MFDCGSINSRHGFQLLEAFHFALEQVNSKNGIFSDVLSGVRLGGLGFDVCQSKIKGGQLASNIHNGLTTLIWNGKVWTIVFHLMCDKHFLLHEF